jgi:hydroxylysine kinase
MSAPPLGSLLGSAPPVIPAEALSALLDQHYGLQGPLKLLTSERDLNYHLATPSQGYVVKLANPAEPAEVTDFQTAALIHLEGSRLPVPRLIRPRSGETGVAIPQGWLRVLTYLEGLPQHLSPASPEQAANMARMAALLSLALAGFSHPAARHHLQWDLKQAAGLAPLLPAIPDTDLRALCQAALARFAEVIAPALPALRWQVVHNDLNPHNVLVDPANPDRIAGILDFGDMVETPLVCDAAIACAYQLDASDAAASLIGFARAYHAVLPLTAAERALFPDLVGLRFVTTLAIASARAARYPENAPYILRNCARSAAGLRALACLDTPALLAELESL